MKAKILLLSVFSLVMLLSVAQEPVGYWKFNEGSGTTVADELGTTNGDLVNSVASTWTTGFEGSALDFSQMAEGAVHVYAGFPGDGVADIPGTQSFSISFIIKADITLGSEQSIISKGVPYTDNGGWYHFSLKEGALRFMIWDNVDENMTSPEGVLPLGYVWDSNEWYHIVCVRDRDADFVYVYLNGQLLDSAADITEVDIATDGILSFGCVANDGWSSQYKGSLDEVKLFNSALSREFILQMAVDYGFAEPNAIGATKLDAVSVNSVKGGIEVEAGVNVEVYSIDGKIVEVGTSNGFISCGAGVYIVKAAGIISKVVVK